MNKPLLVSTHISSIFTAFPHVTTHAVPTSRRDVPLVTTQNTEIPEGHASYSSLFSSEVTGPIVLRVVQDELAVELLALASDISPVRFVFPSQVLPSPTLVLWEDRQLHLLVATTIGSIYRIIIPAHANSQLWHEPLRKDWYREWQMKKHGGTAIKLFHVQTVHSVVLGLDNGGLLRLETEFLNDETYNEQWAELEYRSSNWYKSLLPGLPIGSSASSEIISLTSVPPPTDSTDVFSLSRDRTLRHWNVTKGCKAEISLAPMSGSPNGLDRHTSLLDATSQKMIMAYTDGRTEGEVSTLLQVLVFVPTPTSSSAGGYFQSYAAPGTSLIPGKVRLCSSASAHCRMQNFIYDGDVLYVLWEKQGRSFLDTITGAFSVEGTVWDAISYSNDPELNQVHMEELLLQPGSLSDKFLRALLRPGTFSPLSLQMALHEYRQHYLSLPGPHPPNLSAHYATLSEGIAAVVGCTIQLTRDPHTGVTQYSQYWNALRRDWEGFLVRCREMERSARWPLALGYDSSQGRVVLMERERLGHYLEEDTPMRLHRYLENSLPIEPTYSLLDVCWTLKSKLGVSLTRAIESEVLNILKQEFAFPLADIITEASNRAFSRDGLDDGLESWVSTRVATVENFDDAIRTLLDIIGGLDKTVKQEEEEVQLIILPRSSEWHRSLVTAYISESINVRYDCCIALAALLFFLGPELRQYDPALLLEVFAVFRGVAILRFLCEQPGGDLNGAKPSGHELPSGDDVVARLSHLHMSRESKNPDPAYSLVHNLLAHSSHTSQPVSAAHEFLDQTGLLSTITPAVASKAEVLVCERLRLLGYRDAARHILSGLPRSPAVSYVSARLCIEGGCSDDAALTLQGVAGAFGPENSLTPEDREALTYVLPGGQIFATDFEYYCHAAELFRSASLAPYDTLFCKLALSVAPEGLDTSDIWAALIKGNIDLGLYEEAYASLVISPYESLRLHHVGQLVYKMCENTAVDRLLSLNFGEMAREVEESLSFKARHADPRVLPNYAHILYTWYIHRGDYRNAASTMYLRALKLAEMQGDPSQLLVLAEEQAEAMMVAMNAMSIVDPKNSWITVPLLPGSTREARKRRKLDCHIPAEKFVNTQKDIDIVTLSDIRQEHALLTAKVDLFHRDPSLLRSVGISLPAYTTVSRLVQAGLIDLAISTARAAAVDMTEIFQRLTMLCLRLSAAPESTLLEIATSDWLLTDKVSSWPGTPAERGWRYLRQSLERHDNHETDYKYAKAVLESLLAHDMAASLPPWLIQSLEEQHPDHLIRTCLQYGYLEGALQYAGNLLKKSNQALDRLTSRQSSATWLPYSLIESVLNAVDDEPDVTDHVKALRQLVQTELNTRLSRVQKHQNDRSL